MRGVSIECGLSSNDSAMSGPAFACSNRTSGNRRLSQRTTGPGRIRAAAATENRPKRCAIPVRMILRQLVEIRRAIKMLEVKRRESEAFIGFGEVTLDPRDTRIL